MMALLMLLAQLSPGPLARPHADLEGVQHCNRCHTPRRGVEARKCLECHQILAARIEAGRGLHAQPEFHRCERRHVEHQGREAELIFWGEGGLQAFDHRKTGYPLEGAHRKIRDCRKCHNPENLPDPEPLRKAHKDLRRTFLGLSRSCTACHRDPHGGQFSDPCKQCHTMDGWKPAARFDHQRTRFLPESMRGWPVRNAIPSRMGWCSTGGPPPAVSPATAIPTAPSGSPANGATPRRAGGNSREITGLITAPPGFL